MDDNPHDPYPRPQPEAGVPRHGPGEAGPEPSDHLKRHDPSRPAHRAPGTSPGRRGGTGGVAWVRAGDLLAERLGRASGRGITWTERANRSPRRAAGTARRAVAAAGRRAARLAPVSAFGNRDRDRRGGHRGLSR